MTLQNYSDEPKLESPTAYVDRLGWHDAFLVSVGRLEKHSSYLQDLADALRITGNQTLSNELYATGMAIDSDVTVARLAVSKYLNDEFYADQKMFHETMGNLVKLALEVGTESESEL